MKMSLRMEEVEAKETDKGGNSRQKINLPRDKPPVHRLSGRKKKKKKKKKKERAAILLRLPHPPSFTTGHSEWARDVA